MPWQLPYPGRVLSGDMRHVRAVWAGPLRVDVASGSAWWDSHRLELTPTQLSLLACLAASSGVPVHWRDLLSYVHGVEWPRELGASSLHVLVCRLRDRLAAAGVPRSLLCAVRGFGYLLVDLDVRVGGSAAHGAANPSLCLDDMVAVARLENGIVQWVSVGFVRMLGWSSARVSGWPLDRVLGSAAAQVMAHGLMSDFAEPRVTRASALCSDGRAISVMAVSWPGIPGLLVLVPAAR